MQVNAEMGAPGYSGGVRFPFLFACVLVVAALVLSMARAAPQKIAFWHYLAPENGGTYLQAAAQEFNKSQGRYEVQPQEVGDFLTIQVKLIASLRSGGLPTLALVDNGFFTRMALGGQLANMNEYMNTLPSSTVQDFYPVLWEYGQVKDARYGLPWAASTQILYYNEDALKARGIAPPRTWDDFAKVARSMTSRASKGAIMLLDAWTWASLVSSRGGNILTPEGRPDFDGAASVETLRYWSELVKAGAVVPRTWSELSFAVVDFLRTKAFMVVAPSSAYPIATKYSYAFKISAVPIPGRTLAGEAQMIVMKAASSDAQRGAFEFWQYLTKPENIAKFGRETFYLPVRKSAVKLLGDVGQHPVMRSSLEMLERSYNPPHQIEFQDWRRDLEEQLERCLKGGVDPVKALAEAQRAALK